MSPIITGVRFKMFTSNGTFVVPEGVTKIYVTGCGGGGGGAYTFFNGTGWSGSNGGSGGTTSLGSLVSYGGGGGGTSVAQSSGLGSAGGSGGAGGESGIVALPNSSFTGANVTIFGASGRIGIYGRGGKAYEPYGSDRSSGSGGSGAFSIKQEISVTPGTSHSVTIGNGGSSSYDTGTQGVLIIEW